MTRATAAACARCRRRLRGPDEPAGKRLPGGSLPAVRAVRRWPEGLICSGCFANACETYGACADCGADRLLPGIRADRAAICTDCAGLGDFTCTRCGREAWRHYAGVCGHCTLADLLDELLDDGTGTVRAELVPFHQKVSAMSRPRSGILWLRKPHVAPILRALARGQVPLTHDGLGTLSPLKSVIHVRDLLVSSGVLPPIDKHLLLFEQWLPDWLAAQPDPAHRAMLHRYATWQLLRQLRDAAARGPVGHYRNQAARAQLRRAAAFLDWLAQHDRTLTSCTQADLDRWHAQARSSDANVLRPFLRWAQRTGRLATRQLPRLPDSSPAPISQAERLRLIRRIHDEPTMDRAQRVLALLVLLYAQPLPRIVRLTIDDVLADADGLVRLRLGDPPIPVPEPFAQILVGYANARGNHTTATNPHSRWLFPGRRADQPLHPTTLRLWLRQLDIPNLNSRSRALRELVVQAPAPVVAAMLGYRPGTAEALAAENGGTWQRYAPGDHQRTRTIR